MKWGINAYVWQRRFAWFPWRMIDGRKVWLEWVEVSGYVENPEIGVNTPYNVRILSTSFVVRPLATPETAR